MLLCVRDIVIIAVPLIAALVGICEYIRQGTQKRAEYFITMRDKFKKNENFQKICKLLVNKDKGIMNVCSANKIDFVSFFEEIALMMNTSLISERIVHYMFGFYAIECLDNEDFWENMKGNARKESPYWRLFREFVEAIRKYKLELEGEGQLNNVDYSFIMGWFPKIVSRIPF